MTSLAVADDNFAPIAKFAAASADSLANRPLKPQGETREAFASRVIALGKTRVLRRVRDASASAPHGGMGRTVPLGSCSLIALLLGAASPAVAQSIPPGVAIDATDNDVSPSSPNPTTWNLGGSDLRVGQNGRGALTIGAGGNVRNLSGHIGLASGSVGTVSVAGPGAVWLNSGHLFVGDGGQGTLTIGAGGFVTNGHGNIGYGANAVGTVTVAGAGARWENFYDLSAGLDGQGTLTIGAGGTVTSRHGAIGANSGSVGTVTVAGTGARWDNSRDLTVGNSGRGTLTIGAGGTVTNRVGTIGTNSGSVGAVTVAGTDARWDNSGDLTISHSGQGTLTIGAGGIVTNADGLIGAVANAVGTVTVEGQGARWAHSGNLSVGLGGQGTLSIGAGGTVTNGVGAIGHDNGSVGTVTVAGTDARWVNSSDMMVGRGGAGTLSIGAGGTVTNAYGTIGDDNGSVGTVTVAGAGAAWTNADNLHVGYGGQGTLSIGAGGTVANAWGTIGFSNSSVGTASVAGAGARWENSRDLTVGDAGQGRLGIGAGGTVTNAHGYVGRSNGSVGTATVAGTAATWSNSSNLHVGHRGQGTLTIGAGGIVTNGQGFIGAAAADAVGTVTVEGLGATWTNSIDLFVGNSGQGTLSIGAGGTVTNGVGYVGRFATSVGTVTVAGAGARWDNSNDLFVGNSGHGTLTIADGGTVSSAAGSGLVHLGYSSTSAGTLNIGAASGGAAGTLKAAEIRFGDGTGKLVFNHADADYRFSTRLVSSGTGTHSVAHLAGTTLLTGDSSGFAGMTTVSGGKLLVGDATGGTLGGIVNVANGGTLGGAGTLTGNVTVDGTLSAGNSPGTLTFTSNLTLSGGSRTVFELNTPGSVGGTGPATGNDLVKVGGTLTLGGTLEARVASAGYYRLFDYGTLTAGSTFGMETVTSTNGGFTVASHQVQYGIPDQVNLSVLGASQTMHFWDGADTTGNGSVDGAAGIWSSTGTNWTGMPGQANINGTWGGSVGVFRGAAGTVTVSGTQNFDTLQFSTNGYVLSGGALAFNPASGPAATILVDNGVGVTIGSVLTDGTGNSLTKTGAGTLTLTGANTYTGGSTINAGVLSVAADANLGAASGGLAFNGGRLATTAGFDTARAVTLGAGGGGFDVGAATTLGLTGTVSGPGDLIKQGAGTLVLTGANGYGNTLVQAGTLIGNAASISGTIGTAGTVVFDQATDASFAGNIAGLSGNHGAMIKRGAGTLTLAGSSVLDWSVETGGLVSATNRFGGNVAIASPGSFSFDQASDGAYAGIVSGAGRFAKTGTGNLLLTGNSSGFTGLTTISGGMLSIGDASGGSLGGSLIVASGGLLGGTGTVGSTGSTVTIAFGGVHAPGNSIGTQTIAGNYANHGTLRIEGRLAQTDKIVVAGTVDISGATLDLVPSPTTAASWNVINSPFTIIDKQSAGVVTGTFATVTSNLVFLDPRLDYAGGDGNDVTLQLTRNAVGFASVGMTRNQVATGAAVETLPDTSSVWRAVALSTSPDIARRSFDALSGEVHASAKSALIEDSRFVRAAAIDRLRAAFGAVGASPTPVMAYAAGGPELAPATTDRFAAWGTAFGAWGRFNGDGNAARFTRSTGGFLIGADGLVADNWRLGLLAGYSRSTFNTRDRAASGASDNYHLGLYAGTEWGNLAFRSGLAYTWHDVAAGRSVALPGFADSLKSKSGAGTVQVFGELGYRLGAGSFRLEPFANLAYVSLRTDGFAEQGGMAALSIRAGSTGATFTTLGLRAETGFAFGAIEATARATLGWRHAFGNTIPLSTQAFAGSSAFTIAGVPIARDSAVVDAGLDLKLTGAATVGLSYAGQIARGAQDHGVKANLAVRF
ncbi:autotransporter domain-containing protein [Phreatobacter stygius]|uniref:autotransporter domain-containing protein n=1 Tax=Phreatobacter stygius TaxID=1940610 RepID=UPI001476F0FA|nr:autotransporter domain-containing protein [Phreatobacter stygius]